MTTTTTTFTLAHYRVNLTRHTECFPNLLDWSDVSNGRRANRRCLESWCLFKNSNLHRDGTNFKEDQSEFFTLTYASRQQLKTSVWCWGWDKTPVVVPRRGDALQFSAKLLPKPVRSNVKTMSPMRKAFSAVLCSPLFTFWYENPVQLW